MEPGAPPGCARCGTILEPQFRFCPECSLSVAGESAMSTDIEGLRRKVALGAAPRGGTGWSRYALPLAASAMGAFVVLLGLVLFNRSLLDRVIPAQPEVQSGIVPPRAPHWEPEWIEVAPGRFPYGEPAERRQAEVRYAFSISRMEVPNSLWFDYLASEHARLWKMGLWYESFPRNLDEWSEDAAHVPHLRPESGPYPVTNVSPVAIAEFCAWLTRRLAEPGWEIRMPTQLEWEYAARGSVGRTFPWGNDDVLVPKIRTGGGDRPRAGIDSALYRVDDPQLAAEDTSALGVVAMGTNVSEWTVMPDLDERPAGAPEHEIEEFLSAATMRSAIEDRRLVVARRGASAGCDEANARTLAKTWVRTISEPRDTKYDVGIRLVKVKAQR